MPITRHENGKTDKNGHFSFVYNREAHRNVMGNPFYVMTRDTAHDSVATAEVSPDQFGTNLVLRMQPGLTLSGSVVNSKAQGIGGASLAFWLHEPGYDTDLQISCTTDADGHYVAKGLPTGWRYKIVAAAKGYGHRDITLSQPAPAMRTIQVEPISLPTANLRVGGVVLDKTKKPASNARISMGGTGQTNAITTADNNGRFSFPLRGE